MDDNDLHVVVFGDLEGIERIQGPFKGHEEAVEYTDGMSGPWVVYALEPPM